VRCPLCSVCRPGGEPLWIVLEKTRNICLGARMAANLVKQAAPAKVSTRDRFIGALNGSRVSERHAETKHRVR
jgi:hypothetical protein